jgi:AcrR family transcriptional regulator
MDEIAASVGITAAALYRHFPNKYALFVECARGLVDGLVDTLDGLPADADLPSTLAAIAHVTVTNRSTAGLYRWEARYLEGPDRAALGTAFRAVTAKVAGAIRTERTMAAASRSTVDHDTSAVADFLAVGALGAIGSATVHRTTIGARRLERVLTDAALRVARLPHAFGRFPEPAEPRELEADRRDADGFGERSTGRKGQILGAAIELFYRDGYPAVTMEAIADAVGLTPSGLYRHYRGKSDILLAACLQAAELLDAAVDRALQRRRDEFTARQRREDRARGSAAHPPVRPEVAAQAELIALIGAYVGYSFEHAELTAVAAAELGGLPADVQRPLRAAQRDHLARWEGHLGAARPDLDPVVVRVLVHAGLGVVQETGRRLRWVDTPENRARVAATVPAALVPATPVPVDLGAQR